MIIIEDGPVDVARARARARGGAMYVTCSDMLRDVATFYNTT